MWTPLGDIYIQRDNQFLEPKLSKADFKQWEEQAQQQREQEWWQREEQAQQQREEQAWQHSTYGSIPSISDNLVVYRFLYSTLNFQKNNYDNTVLELL